MGKKLFNYRRVDDKLSLSGGWQYFEDEIEHLVEENVVAVLDLQFGKNEDKIKADIEKVLALRDIEYFAITMNDAWTPTLENIYTTGIDVIDNWMEKYPNGRILVKCQGGMSRSVSMLVAWYCEHTDLSVLGAEQKIKKADGYIGIGPTIKAYLVSQYG